MKHRRIIISILVLAVSTLSSPVFAEEVNINAYGRASTTSVKVRTEIKAEVETRRASTTERREERREEMKTNLEERKASSTARRVEFQQGIAKRKAEHVAQVLAATVERLEKITVRLESRIAKVKAAGGVTTESEGFVAEAKTHLSLARSSIALFVSLDLTDEKARDNFEKVRAVATETKSHIREAHRSLMMAVRSLKGASDEE